jgi:hypothetical protein
LPARRSAVCCESSAMLARCPSVGLAMKLRQCPVWSRAVIRLQQNQ